MRHISSERFQSTDIPDRARSLFIIPSKKLQQQVLGLKQTELSAIADAIMAGTREVHGETHDEPTKTELLDHRGIGESPARPTPATARPQQEPAKQKRTLTDRISNPKLRYIAGALVVGNLGLVATCGGLLYSGKKGLLSDEITVTDTGLTIPKGWKPCTAKEFAEINAQRQIVREHQWRFAEELVKRSHTGVTKDGAVNHDAHKLTASFAVVDEDVANFFNLHQQSDDRIWCYEKKPKIVTEADDTKWVDYPSVAAMHHNDTPDNIADDMMGYNTYWLRQDAPPPLSSSIWHEMGHKYLGGQGHSKTIADIGRSQDDFSLAILAEGDFSYYNSLVIDTADDIVDTYLALIRADIETGNNNARTAEQLAKLAAEYHIEPKEEAAWARNITDTFFYNYDVLEPLGVSEADVAAALQAGNMHEIANERVAEYFAELTAEVQREQKQEIERKNTRDTDASELRLPNDTGSKRWR